MTQLTDAQIKLLNAATDSVAGYLPAADAPQSTVAALIKRGMLISIPQRDGGSHLLITEPGRSAINRPTGPAIPAAEPAAPEGGEPAQQPAKPKGKVAILVDLMAQPGGATIEAMMEATGWQAHSVRGAIAGVIKKAQGHTVISEKLEGARTYRIAAAVGA